MTLEDLGNIGEFVGSIGVVVSLAYLAIQIRIQNNESQATRNNDLASQWLDFMAGLAADSNLAMTWIKGLNNLSELEPSEQVRFMAFMGQFAQITESLHKHHTVGKLDSGIWKGYDSRVTDIMANSGAQRYWEMRNHWYSDEFRDYIDGKIALGTNASMYTELTKDA